jgi:hypothetical protein
LPCSTDKKKKKEKEYYNQHIQGEGQREMKKCQRVRQMVSMGPK